MIVHKVHHYLKTPALAQHASSGIDIHLLHYYHIVLRGQLMYGNVLAYLLSGDDLLVEHSCSSPLEFVAPLLLLPLIRLDVVPHQSGLVGRNHTHIHV